jgi:hypothetical protein
MYKRLSNYLFCLFLIAAFPLAAQSDFKPSGKAWGLAFTDFYWKASGDTATWASRAEYSGVLEDVYAFGIRRAYLGYDHQISPVFSASVLLEGTDAILTSRGDRGVTIKTLSLRWKDIYPNADLMVGQIPTIAYTFIVEKVWGYRSVEKTLLDMRSVRSSSDAGVALYGRLDSLGNAGYNVMIGNGTGTRPEDLTASGKHKVFSLELYKYFMDKKLVLDLYGDHATGINDRTVLTMKAFIGFQLPAFNFGAEIFSMTQNSVKSDGADAKVFGYSLFARAPIVKDKLSFYARYDSFDPDNNYREKDAPSAFLGANMFRHYSESFFLAGLDFTPHKSVHIMPNIWINAYDPKLSNEILVERKADVVPRITVFFTTK